MSTGVVQYHKLFTEAPSCFRPRNELMCFWRNYVGFLDIIPNSRDQMEKNIENEMETGDM